MRATHPEAWDLRLSASGRAVAGGSVVLYAVGVALGYDLLVTVGAGGLVALALGTALVARRPAVTADRRLEPDRVVAGGRAEAAVVVTNRSRRRSPRLAIVDHAGPQTIPVAVPRLPAGATVWLPYAIDTPRRGVIPLGPLAVRRVDPLGLVTRRPRHAPGGQLWVHPRTHLATPVPRSVDVELDGGSVAGAPRGAVTFSSLRPYVPGDDVRRIHWRSSARNPAATLLVRDHVDTSRPRTTVALDLRAERWRGDAFEHGVATAGSLALAARRAGQPAVVLAAADGSRSTGTPTSLLDELSLVAPLDEGGERVLDHLDVGTPGGAAVVVTGGADGPTLTRVAGLRRRFPLVVLVQIEPDGPAWYEQRNGLLVLTAGSSAAAVALWNRAVRR